jgi:hypothetical protein
VSGRVAFVDGFGVVVGKEQHADVRVHVVQLLLYLWRFNSSRRRIDYGQAHWSVLLAAPG